MRKQTSSENQKQTIQAFWTWFVENEARLRELFESGASADLVRTIRRGVENVTELNWELGAGREASTHQFAFCPSDDEELTEATELIRGAPVVAKWELCNGRPPKDVSEVHFRFDEVDYETSFEGWTYQLTAFDTRRFFDVTLFAGTNIPSKPRLKAARLAVQLLLGDHGFVKLIDRVKIVDSPQTKDATPIEHFREHIMQIAHPESVEAVEAEIMIVSAHTFGGPRS